MRRERIPRQQRLNSGIALPAVLLLVSMMLVTSAAWFEVALLGARNTRGAIDYLRAFRAADAALIACQREVVAGLRLVPVTPLVPGEPQAWRRETTFDLLATSPIPSWPRSPRAPQCVVEAWRLASRPAVRAFLLTSRGFGAAADVQVRLQLQLVIDGERIERHWRRVTARPF